MIDGSRSCLNVKCATDEMPPANLSGLVVMSTGALWLVLRMRRESTDKPRGQVTALRNIFLLCLDMVFDLTKC